MPESLICLERKFLRLSGNALAQVQWVHKPVDHVLHPLILRLLVLLPPADFEDQCSIEQIAPADPNS